MAQPMPGMARLGHRWCLRLMGRMVSPSPPKPWQTSVQGGWGWQGGPSWAPTSQNQPEQGSQKADAWIAYKSQGNGSRRRPWKIEKVGGGAKYLAGNCGQRRSWKKAASSTKSEDDSKEGDPSLKKAQETCQMMALVTRPLTTWTLATGQGPGACHQE